MWVIEGELMAQNPFRRRALFTCSAFFALGIALGNVLLPTAAKTLALVAILAGAITAIFVWERKLGDWRFLGVAALCKGLGVAYPLLLYTHLERMTV